MYYNNFDSHITQVYKVVIENWPIRKFCRPSDIGSCNEIQLVINAFQSGAACFRKLTDVEYELWMQDQFQKTMGSILDTEKRAVDGVDPLAASISTGVPSALDPMHSDQALASTPVTDTSSAIGLTVSEDVPSRQVATTFPSPDAMAPAISAAPVPPVLCPAFSVLDMRQARQKRHLPSDENNLGPLSKWAATVSSMASANGLPLDVVKKPCKVRKDKGQKRKVRGTTGSIDIDAATTATRMLTASAARPAAPIAPAAAPTVPANTPTTPATAPTASAAAPTVPADAPTTPTTIPTAPAATPTVPADASIVPTTAPTAPSTSVYA